MSVGAEQLAAVKEYIAKHNLQEELSAATNVAIKSNSEDPLLVVSDYLRSRAKASRTPSFESAHNDAAAGSRLPHSPCSLHVNCHEPCAGRVFVCVIPVGALA